METSTGQPSRAGPTTLHGLSNHPERHTDGALQLLRLAMRLQPPSGDNPGRRWQLLWDDPEWRGQQRWDDLHHRPEWHTEDTSQHCYECPDGEYPQAELVLATNGDFYGTMDGGVKIHGTIFDLSVGLGPFVKTLPHSGMVGAVIMILGTDLTGATRVSFNGTPAAFTVVSATEITTTVPTGRRTARSR